MGAVIANAIVLLTLIVTLQHALGGPPRLVGVRKFAENLLFLTLAPILLPMLLFLFGRVAIDVIKSRLSTGKWPRNERFIAEMQERKKPRGKSDWDG
jgi:hypothetical protein